MQTMLEALKAITKENIKNRKKFEYKVPSRFEDTERFYLKLLEASLGEKTKKKEEYNTAVIHHSNVLLAMAFSKAEKLFSTFVNKHKGEYHAYSDEAMSTAEPDETLSFISPLEALHLSAKQDHTGEKKKKDPEELKDLKQVLSVLNRFQFERDGIVTEEALLFIACMFLRKSDAEYFVKKWKGLKNSRGAFRTTQTFFTYYSIRDKKSLQVQNGDLLKFRKIIGILSTLPEFDNKCFAELRNYINQHNEKYGRKADQSRSKAEKEKWHSYCIPVRKKFNATPWCLEYLKDHVGLQEFEIACYKKPQDRYVQTDGDKEQDVERLKFEMKRATGAEKWRLTEQYKEGKQNFTFKTPGNADLDYCIKNGNAIIRYTLQPGITIQVAISPELLMKWAFFDVIFDQGKLVKEKLINHIRNQYYALINQNFSRKKILLPPSLNPNMRETSTVPDVQRVKQRIEEKQRQLGDFKTLNTTRKAPWKYGAKQKIDIVLQFAHLSYTYQALLDKKDANVRRHEALSDTQYLDAFHFLRFYGRYYRLPEFRSFFYDLKAVYFKSLHSLIENSESLEQLYNNVHVRFDELYTNLKGKVNGEKLELFGRLFRFPGFGEKEETSKASALFAINQVLPGDVIDLQDLLSGSQILEDWKGQLKDSERTNDFSLIRYTLSKDDAIDTNTDFIMKVIMPELQFRTNENGTIKGTTSFFRTLMKNKSEELLLWAIAKRYWKRAYGSDYIPGKGGFNVLQRGINKVTNTPYKQFLPFYSIFNQELEVAIFDKTNKEKEVIKIRAKKFDDEFQYYETNELYNFIKAYKPRKGSDGFWHYEDLNRQLKETIAKYLDDVYLILSAEKIVVDLHYELFSEKLHERSKTDWDGYYLIFGRLRPESEYENLIVSTLYKEMAPLKVTQNDLIDYRNKILHQQIHPDNKTYKAVREALITYCAKNGAIP